jgi:hypothetical protein
LDRKLTTDLVISVYNEEITWLLKRNFSNENIFAYNKFERFDYNFAEKLPNVGRESHTYIWHIIKNYDDIKSDYTMFLQGDPYPHLNTDEDKIEWKIFHNELVFKNLYYPLGELVACDSLGKPFSKWECEVFSLWNALFDSEIPTQFIANFGAQQVVHKSLILNRSKKFWELALNLHYVFDNAPWAFEILWFYIFDPIFVSKI